MSRQRNWCLFHYHLNLSVQYLHSWALFLLYSYENWMGPNKLWFQIYYSTVDPLSFLFLIYWYYNCLYRLLSAVALFCTSFHALNPLYLPYSWILQLSLNLARTMVLCLYTLPGSFHSHLTHLSFYPCFSLLAYAPLSSKGLRSIRGHLVSYAILYLNSLYADLWPIWASYVFALKIDCNYHQG